MLKYTVLFAFIAIIAATSALNSEDELALITAAMPYLNACSEELDISKEEILAAKENKNIDALNPCFYFCVAKKAGILNDDGFFDAEFAQKKGKELIKNEASLEAVTNIIKTCSAVNDQTVADGCERSRILLTCVHKENSSLM